MGRPDLAGALSAGASAPRTRGEAKRATAARAAGEYE